MEVTLVRFTEKPEQTCAASALVSTTETVPDSEFNEISQEKASKILNSVVSMGHHSVVEHAVFTFHVKEVSRALTHQLVRHRIASYTQQSQRYVKLAGKGYVTPDSVVKANKKEEFDALMAGLAKAYDGLTEAGIPPEDARYILPNAAKTNIVITMNARELLHFFALRSCNRAQWEIREMSDLMLVECKRVAPSIFAKSGPGCIRGPCPEGKWSCGKPRNNESLFQ